MTDEPVLDADQIREVLQLLSRELGVTPTATTLAEQPELHWLGDPRLSARDDALAQPCGHCGHQVACHVGGREGTGWAIYDPVWMNATGSCSVRGCDCTRAVRSTNGQHPTQPRRPK